MAYTNNSGGVRIGVRIVPQVNASTLWNSVYAIYNADAVGSSSLKTSLYAVYNGESNTNDSFGSNNGTAQGGLTYGVGKIGNSFQFNGTNAYVSLPNNSLNFTGDFSVSFWMKAPDANLNGGMLLSNLQVSVGVSTYYGWQIIFYNGQIYFITGSNTGNSTASTRLVSNALSGYIGNWVHVTCTHKQSSGYKIYVNGVLNNSNNGTYNPVYYDSHTPSIGAQYSVNASPNLYYPFNGNLDAMSVWQKELTQSEITELYNSGNGTQYITDSFYKPTTNNALGTNNGTPQGGLTYGVGKVGTAFQFNGSNAYVSLPANSLKFTNSTFSTSMWMYIPSNVSADQILIGCLRFPSGWRGWGISMYQNTIYFYIVTTSGKLDVTYGDNSLIGQWAHLVATHENGVGGKLYVNGVLRTTVANVNPIVYDSVETPSIGCAFVAGAGQPTWFMKNGSKLDAIGVWNRVLTQTEITELYNSGNAKQYPN